MPHIIPTIGPATDTVENLTKLYQDGIRILRMNFSHFTPESAKPVIDLIHQVEQSVDGKFSLMMDIEGPSIRT
jgi:pyruvate kinase